MHLTSRHLKDCFAKSAEGNRILSHKEIETYCAVTNNQTEKTDDSLKASTLEIIYGGSARTLLAFTLQPGGKIPGEHLHYAAV